MKNESLTKKQKQKKFIITLITLGILIGAVFTLWYLWQKNLLYSILYSPVTNNTTNNKVENNSNTGNINSVNPTTSNSDLEDHSALNIFNSKFIFERNYDDYSVLQGFNFVLNLSDKKQTLNAQEAKSFWNDFEKNYGKPDLDNAHFEALGNKVTILFKTLEKYLNFKRVITYKKLGDDYVVSGDSLEELPLTTPKTTPTTADENISH